MTHALLPQSPFLSDTPPVRQPAAESPSSSLGVAAVNSVSPGAFQALCPQGESEPAVRLAYGPGENRSPSCTGGSQEASAPAIQNPAGVELLDEIIACLADRRFVLDERRFMEDIEEMPVFLRRSA